MFKWIEETFGQVDICIPNAGFSADKSLLDGSMSEWKAMLDVNVLGNMTSHFSRHYLVSILIEKIKFFVHDVMQFAIFLELSVTSQIRPSKDDVIKPIKSPRRHCVI